MNKLNPDFKLFVVFVLGVIGFAAVGFNQVTFQKTQNLAVQDSQQAVNMAASTESQLKALVTPTATPSAVTPAVVKTVVPATRVVTVVPVK